MNESSERGEMTPPDDGGTDGQQRDGGEREARMRQLVTRWRIPYLCEADLVEALCLAPYLRQLLTVVQKTRSRDGFERWRHYARAKRAISAMVGWQAPALELRTTRHYETVMRAVDWLLPDPFDVVMGGDEDEAPAYDRDEVASW